MTTEQNKIEAAEMIPGKLYSVDQVIGIVKVRTKRGRTMRVLLTCDWEDLSPREQDRVYRWMNR